MTHKRIDNTVIARLDKGDEILSSLIKIAESENIKAADFTGIGATDCLTVGIFDISEGKYAQFDFDKENYEITSLMGNISFVNKKPYIHAHINFAGKDGIVHGGHLLKGKISLTCEIFIHIVNDSLGREFDPNIKINKFSF